MSKVLRRPGLLALAVLLVTALAAGFLVEWVTGEASVRSAAESPSGNVSVYPAPGTPTASAETSLSFRGTTPPSNSEIQVVGSESGKHSGKIVRHRDGNGFTFRPDKPFQPGERVEVRTQLAIRGARHGDFEFGIAQPFQAGPPGAGKEGPDLSKHFRDFVSRPKLHPPKIDVVRSSPQTAKGYIFTSPKIPLLNAEQEGPMIVNDQGDVVWFKPLGGDRAMDFKVQRYRGEKVLTWWEGHTRYAYGGGEFVIMNDHYEVVTRVEAGNGYADADAHDFIITPRGTALFFAVNPVWWSVPGSGERRPVLDNVIQEVDIQTGNVLFEWHSLRHVRLDESYRDASKNLNKPLDYFHANSIEIVRGGDLLVSARNTSAVYKIDRQTGEIVWRLGGKESDFDMGPGTTFAFQHDARRRPNGTITLFDNAADYGGDSTDVQSRGIVLKLDRQDMTASLVREYESPDNILATSQGNMQKVPGGHVFLGWGSAPAYSEYTAGGKLLYYARFPGRVESYRAFRFRWEGHPTTDPAIGVKPAKGSKVAVYASWNGATEVAKWQVLAGPAPGKLRPVASKPKKDFETRINVSTDARYVAVRARGVFGGPLGTSQAVKANSPSRERMPVERDGTGRRRE